MGLGGEGEDLYDRKQLILDTYLAGEMDGHAPPATPALTKMIVALSVVSCHVGAAAPVPLADAALVQCVGGEEHSVTANGLQEARREAAEALWLAQGRHRLWQAGGQHSEDGYTFGTMFNNLTFSRHANPSQVSELAGSAIAGGHHELPLAIHSGAVQIAGLTGDVDVVIWRVRQRVSGERVLDSPHPTPRLLLLT